MKKTWYRIENATADEADVYIYNDIGMFGVSAEQFVDELNAITASVINVHINSYGGEVFDGLAMFNAIRAHDARFVAHIDGVSASAATYPTLACDEVRIAKNAMLMIHNPWVLAVGEASELRKEADILDKLRDRIADLYVDASGADLNQIIDWMDEETWFDASEALDAGFATSITDDSDEVPDNPTNKRGQYWNNKSRPRVRPSDRVKALGLTELLTPEPKPPVNAGRKAVAMAADKKKPAAEAGETPVAVWPDAATVAAGVKYGPNGDDFTGTLQDEKVESPTNASIAQIKAEFAGDTDFILERIEVSAPLIEHKAAYADRLKQQNKTLRDQIDSAKPGLPGRKPVDTPAPESNVDGPKPITEARKKELLALAGR